MKRLNSDDTERICRELAEILVTGTKTTPGLLALVRRPGSSAGVQVSRMEAIRITAAGFSGARGYPTGGNGGGGSGPGDPTGNAALRPADRLDTADVRFAAAMRALEHAARMAHLAALEIESHARHKPRQRAFRCANPHCGELVITEDGDIPDLDRCRPCAAWLATHPTDAGPKKIADRRRKRAEREAQEATA